MCGWDYQELPGLDLWFASSLSDDPEDLNISRVQALEEYKNIATSVRTKSIYKRGKKNL